MVKETKCEKCNSSIEYKTKRPKECSKCKKGKPKFYRRKNNNLIKSKKEGLMQRIMDSILPEEEYIDNGYYSWLRSPKNAPMQLDRFYPRLKIGFEFNGKQHYEYNTYMHKDIGAFNYLQECDKIKSKIMKKLGYKLITIKYDKKLSKEYMIRRLTEEGIIKYLIENNAIINED